MEKIAILGIFIGIGTNLQLFFNPENLLADKNQLFPCVLPRGPKMANRVWIGVKPPINFY